MERVERTPELCKLIFRRAPRSLDESRLCARRSVLVAVLVFVLCLVRGVALEALGLVLGVALHLAREILGVLLRALGGVLRVAAGTLGRALRLFGQLGRLPLFVCDLRLRLAAQTLLKLPLVAQLLLGGVLLVPLLMRGGVLLMSFEQLGLMLGAALVSLGALALGCCRRASMRAALEGWLAWKSWSRWSRRSRTCSTSSG